MIYNPRHINGLPVTHINELLSLELTHDIVHISNQAIKHIKERHPDDYVFCLESLETVVQLPDLTGQSPLHPDHFVLIKQIKASFLLAAISAIPDEYSEYPLMSSYIIDKNVVQRRIRKGFFKPIKKGI